jgi:predicted XRE-type DNA-binding protein
MKIDFRKKKKENKDSEMLETAISELQFKNLLIKELQNLIEEVKVLNNRGISQKLINRVIENGMDRFNLDKLIKYNEYGNSIR